MKRVSIALCCLMLTASPLAFAQNTSAGNKNASNPTAKGQAEQNRQNGQKRMAGCINKAQQDKMSPGTAEFDRYMARCMNG